MFEYEVVIARPVREVYAAFNNGENKPLWLAGFQRLEPISGIPGEVGATSRHFYAEQERVVELTETITAHEPCKLIAADLAGYGLTCSIEVQFLGEGDRTRVRLRSEVRALSLKLAMMLPLFRSSLHKRQQDDLHRFKQLIERGELQS